MSQSVLVLGASGYIGQHLVRALSARGYPVLAAARHIDRLQKLALPGVTCRSVDLNQPQALPALLTGIDTLYYLVHGMGEGGDFIAHERRVATHVRDALRQIPVRQIIFLSSLQAPAQEQSDHLRARQVTARAVSRPRSDQRAEYRAASMPAPRAMRLSCAPEKACSADDALRASFRLVFGEVEEALPPI